MMTLRNLDVLSVIHHELFPLLLAEVGIGNRLWVFGVVVCWYVPPSRYFSVNVMYLDHFTHVLGWCPQYIA